MRLSQLTKTLGQIFLISLSLAAIVHSDGDRGREQGSGDADAKFAEVISKAFEKGLAILKAVDTLASQAVEQSNEQEQPGKSAHTPKDSMGGEKHVAFKQQALQEDPLMKMATKFLPLLLEGMAKRPTDSGFGTAGGEGQAQGQKANAGEDPMMKMISQFLPLIMEGLSKLPNDSSGPSTTLPSLNGETNKDSFKDLALIIQMAVAFLGNSGGSEGASKDLRLITEMLSMFVGEPIGKKKAQTSPHVDGGAEGVKPLLDYVPEPLKMHLPPALSIELEQLTSSDLRQLGNVLSTFSGSPYSFLAALREEVPNVYFTLVRLGLPLIHTFQTIYNTFDAEGKAQLKSIYRDHLMVVTWKLRKLMANSSPEVQQRLLEVVDSKHPPLAVLIFKLIASDAAKGIVHETLQMEQDMRDLEAISILDLEELMGASEDEEAMPPPLFRGEL